MREIKVIIEHATPVAKKAWMERNHLIAAFFLTTVAGGAISTTYQYFANHLQEEREIQAAQRKAAQAFLIEFQNTSELRNYYAYRVVSHIEDKQIPDASQELNELLRTELVEYRKACREWNLKYNLFERFLEIYGSPNLRKKFYEKGNPESVVARFEEIHRCAMKLVALDEKGKEVPLPDIVATKKMRESLSETLASIYDELLRMSLE